MALHQSGEDYLEAIYILSGRGKTVRSVDVAALLGVTKPSVSRAMSILRAKGYLAGSPEGGLILTELGQTEAQRIYERHEVLTRFLTSLGVSQETAEDDACRIEHVISEESFNRLRDHAYAQIEKERN